MLRLLKKVGRFLLVMVVLVVLVVTVAPLSLFWDLLEIVCPGSRLSLLVADLGVGWIYWLTELVES